MSLRMHGRGRYWAVCAIAIAAIALTACGGEAIDEAALSVPQAPQTIATEQGPRALAFDGTHLWVTLYGVGISALQWYLVYNQRSIR